MYLFLYCILSLVWYNDSRAGLGIRVRYLFVIGEVATICIVNVKCSQQHVCMCVYYSTQLYWMHTYCHKLIVLKFNDVTNSNVHPLFTLKTATAKHEAKIKEKIVKLLL